MHFYGIYVHFGGRFLLYFCLSFGLGVSLLVSLCLFLGWGVVFWGLASYLGSLLGSGLSLLGSLGLGLCLSGVALALGGSLLGVEQALGVSLGVAGGSGRAAGGRSGSSGGLGGEKLRIESEELGSWDPI